MDNRLRILAVDDDKLIRMNLGLMLGQAGFEIDVASDAAEARAMLDAHHYALLVVDFALPDGTGLDVLREARRLDPETKAIMITGSTTGLSVEDVARAGAEALLMKPFKLHDLLDEIQRALTTISDSNGVWPRAVPAPLPVAHRPRDVEPEGRS